MRILLKGYYGYGNLGDDILMIVSYQLLKRSYPSSSITIFSNNSSNNKDAQVVPDYNLYIRKLLSSDVEIIDWTYKGMFDLILLGGGGVYFDNEKSNLTFLNRIINHLRISYISTIDAILRAVLFRTPRIKSPKSIGIGIGIGEYTNSSRLLHKHLSEIGGLHKLVVRDNYSAQFLANRQFRKERLVLNTDIAFLNSWNYLGENLNNEIKTVGLVVKDNLDNDLIKSLIDLYDYLDERNYNVKFYSFDENYDRECGVIFGHHRLIQYRPIEFEKFLGSLKECDLLFTARAHGAIIGACFKIPSVILSTEIKLSEVANMLKRSCTRLSVWQSEILIETFKEINNNYTELKSELELDLAENKSKAEEIINYIT